MMGKWWRWAIPAVALVLLAGSLGAAPPAWNPNITTTFMFIFGKVTLNGVPAPADNVSMIAAFAPGVAEPVGVYRMGSNANLGSGEYGAMTIYGDDSTPAKDGAAANDNLSFRFYYGNADKVLTAFTAFDNATGTSVVRFDGQLVPGPEHDVALNFSNSAPAIAADDAGSLLYLFSDNAVAVIRYGLSDPDADNVVVDNVVFRPAIDNASWIQVFVGNVLVTSTVAAADNAYTGFLPAPHATADNVTIVVQGPVRQKDIRTFNVTVSVHDSAVAPLQPFAVQDNSVSVAVTTPPAASDGGGGGCGCRIARGAPFMTANDAASLLILAAPVLVLLKVRRKK